MSTKIIVTFKIEKQILSDYNELANSLKMNRSKMIRTAISEFAHKQTAA